MDKHIQLYTNPFAEIKVSPVIVGGIEARGNVGIQVQADDGSWSSTPSIVSRDYHVLTNAQVADVGNDIRSRSGMGWSDLKTHWDGKRYIQYFRSTSAITQIDRNGDPAHPIHLGMMVRNSYDGSSVFSLEMFLLNHSCMNQYVSRNLFGFYSIRHMGENTFDIDDAVEQIGRSAEVAIKVAPRIAALRQTPLTTGDLIKANANTDIPTSKWGRVIERLALDEDKGSLYGLFQSLTFIATHEVSGLASLRTSQSVVDYMVK